MRASTLLPLVLASFIPSIAAASAASECGKTKDQRTAPPTGAFVVDPKGSYAGSYPTIGGAVSALVAANSSAEQQLFLLPGTYTEQVYIPKLRGPLTVQGYTCDSRTYGGNQVTITGNLSRTVPGLTSNDQTSTVRLWTANVKFYNLNIENTFGKAATGGQALALSAQNTNQGFYACQFKGYQDTIYANEGRQIYAKSYISGAVDFVFGLRAIAWFEECDIETVGVGYITANGRDAANNTSYYVFNEATVNGTSGPNSTYLGRPWRPYSRVVFQNSYLGDVVQPAGWVKWDNVQSLENVFYREYKNFGPGAVGLRANFSAELRKSIRIVDLLGEGYKSEYWVDQSYL